MDKKYHICSILPYLMSIAILIGTISVSAIDPYNVPGPFTFHEQLNKGTCRDLEQGAPFKNVHKNLLMYIEIETLSQILASWKLAKQNPQEHKEYLESLQCYCLKLHPGKQSECKKLIDSVTSS